MSVEKRLFLGIKQMTKTAFLELKDSEKVGYLWFVRCDDPEHFEIYLGTRLYGETNEAVEEYVREIAEKLRVAIGLTDDLTLPEDFDYEDLISALNEHSERIVELETTVNNLDTSVSDLNNRIETVEGEINTMQDDVDSLQNEVSDIDTRLESVEGDLENLEEFTCGTIVPTTTNFVEGTSYTIHEALQRTANLFGGFQGEIDDINSLIPNQATEQNQLADKAFVNSTIATNAANFRGNWHTWNDVPTVATEYPEDYAGNRTPTNNDYMVVQDASDVILQNEYVDIQNIAHGRVSIVNKDGTSGEWVDMASFPGAWQRYDDRMEFYQVQSGGYRLYVRFSMKVTYNNVLYNENTSITLQANTTMRFYYGMQLDGQWRFMYVGDWATDGKSGWKPQYQIGSSFTAAQQAAIDSTITQTKVNTYDGY